MNILFVAPRYHTNQIPVVKTLKKAGYQVFFAVYYLGYTEDYDEIQPMVLKGNWYWSVINYLSRAKTETERINILLKYFSPQLKEGRKLLSKTRPDIVILRERSIATAIMYFLCKSRKIPSILYNQSPLEKIFDKNWKKILNKFFFPKYRITPVRSESIERYENSFFVPFVVPCYNEINWNKKEGEKIEILSVGKYEKRKNFVLLINVINKINKVFDVHLTIIGEAKREEQVSFFNIVNNLVIKYGLEDTITLKRNIPYAEMYKEYSNHDIFVLASTKELAAISPLEAMSAGCYTICSDYNGTSGYIKKGISGEVFFDMDEDDLYAKLTFACKKIRDNLIKRKDIINYMDDNFSEKNYLKSFENVLREVLS